jgi:hypothetical protein
MKEYKLRAWPELPAPYHRTIYRRMLSDLSQRHLSVQQLATASGATRLEVRAFVQMLADRGLLDEREAAEAAGTAIGRWWRRTVHGDIAEA